MIKKTLFLLVSVALVGSASAAWKKVDDYEDPATLDDWSVTSTGLDVDPAIVPGKVEYVDDPVVSSDIVRRPYSATFDSLATMTLGNRVSKTLTWYDNGWGYAHRVVDLIGRFAEMGKEAA